MIQIKIITANVLGLKTSHQQGKLELDMISKILCKAKANQQGDYLVSELS